MRQKSESQKPSSERIVKDIRTAIRFRLGIPYEPVRTWVLIPPDWGA